MPGSFRVARILGIDVRVHFSWILIFLFFSFQESQLFGANYPSWSDGKAIAVGAITALLFFGSVVVHELAHSVVALRFKMSVHSITLFLLGGVANLTKEPPTARAEFLMAAAGPATSLAIAGLAAVVSALLGHPQRETIGQIVKAVADSLSQINLYVAVFNLIPGFPLDGGRVLRSVIWGVTRNKSASTRVAARGGQLFAALFALAGLYVVFGLKEPTGLWWGLIAYFLFGAASQTLQQERVVNAVGTTRVGQLMTTDFVAVPGGTTIGAVVRDFLLPRNLRAVPVVEDGRFVGLATIGDLRKVEQDRWPVTPVDAVMTRVPDVPTIGSGDALSDALDRFGSDLPVLPVVEGGQLRGLLDRDAVLGYVRMREMLGPSGRN